MSASFNRNVSLLTASLIILGTAGVALRVFLGGAPAEAGALRTVTDLSRLPDDLKQTLVLLLFLPVGGLVTSIFRHLLGVKTFGYFTASLIAISFVFVDWHIAAVVFSVIMTIGIAGRIFVGYLQLRKVPRLNLLLLVVVVSLTLAVSILHYLGQHPRGVLLPVVALTVMIERFHLNLLGQGKRFAVRKLIGTLAVAFLCLLVFRLARVQELALAYPEGGFFVAAGLVMFRRPSDVPRDETVFSDVESVTGDTPPVGAEQ